MATHPTKKAESITLEEFRALKASTPQWARWPRPPHAVVITAGMVRTCANRLEQCRTERDKYIRRMRAEGATLRQIATAANLTAAGVKKILDRHSIPANTSSGPNSPPPNV